jgi:hypothetical protein
MEECGRHGKTMPWRGLARVGRLWDFRATAQFILPSRDNHVSSKMVCPSKAISINQSFEHHVRIVRP